MSAEDADRPTDASVAYFSMEIALETSIPTYAGGLGVLAGDTLRAAADVELPMVAVSLVHRDGYFQQRLDARGHQTEEPSRWSPESSFEEQAPRVVVRIEDKPVYVRAWRFEVTGVRGFSVPVYLLDTDLEENAAEHRGLTGRLYGGDQRYRLCQEAVLGVGGVAILRALGYGGIRSFHMNEGHSALLALALLEERTDRGKAAIEAVRRQCVFTTHTPVPAGHDQFRIELVRRVLGPERTVHLEQLGCCVDAQLNMTYLALFFSRYVNGVAMRHGQVSRGMFPSYPISSITNGVHTASWAAPPFHDLFDRHIPEWRQQNDNLRYAVGIPYHEVQAAHHQCKEELRLLVERRARVKLELDVMTLGFARRATSYKRPELLLSNIDRLRAMAAGTPLQILYAGQAHPHDDGGKEIIRHIFDRASRLAGSVPIVYLADYDMELARALCAGVDLWINTPRQPEEASGTSGMKAAINGVPSLSVLDGWWIEGHVEGVTGWSIGDSWEPEPDSKGEISMLYDKLETIAAMYYGRPDAYAAVMRHTIGLNGSFFTAQRMVEQYRQSAYRS